MHSYDRFVKALYFEEPDRVPTWDLVNNWSIYRALGGIGSVREVVPRTYRRLGIDATRSPCELPVLEERTWKEPLLTGQYLICEKPFTYRSDPRESTTWLVESPIRKLSDIRDLNLHPLSETEILEDFLPKLWSYKRAYEAQGVVYCFCGYMVFDDAMRVLGWPLFIQALYSASSELGRLMDMLAFVQTVLAKAYAEAEIGPAYMYGDDVAYKKGLMVKPSLLRKEWFPRLRRILEPVRRKGLKPLFHSDGYIEPLIKDLIDVGFEGLNPLEPAAGMDIGKVKAEYGDRLVLLGNIDCSQLLPHAQPSEVERVTAATIAEAASGSGFCLGSSSELTAAVTLANAQAMYRACQRYGVYPLKREAKRENPT